MIPVFLVFAGMCLIVNGVWLLQGLRAISENVTIANRDVAILNLFTATIGVVMIVLLLRDGSAAESIESFAPAAYVGLFTATFAWNGLNQFTNVNSSGLGWYCLPVSILALYIGLDSFTDTAGVFDTWIAVSWLTWAVLWLAFFLTLGLKRNTVMFTALLCLSLGPLSLTIPATLVLSGVIS